MKETEQNNQSENDSAYSTQRGTEDFGWLKPIEIDKALLTPQSSTSSFSISVPAYEKKEVAVIILDREGKPFIRPEGDPFYVMREEEVLVGFQTKEIPLPGQEIYNIDLTSSYLTDFDVPALRALISLYGDLQLQVLRGKNRIEDIYYVYNKAMAIVNTAKARNGQTARLSKTTIHEGSSKSEQSFIESYKEAEKRKRAWEPAKE